MEMLDTPNGQFGGAAAGPVPEQATVSMQKYSLATINPQSVVSALEDIGDLDPRTRLATENSTKVIFANATPADHKKIQSMIDRLDGTGRQFEVIWLRRLPADAVAATIYNLMAGQTKEKDDNNRRRYWYPWDDYGNNEEEEEPVKGFGVDADIENNRLLLWANEAEMTRVRDLLIKLGEIPTGQQDPRPVRFVQPSPDISTAELLERLQRAWSATGKNEGEGQRRMAAGDAGAVALVVAVVDRALRVELSERDVFLAGEQRFREAVGDPAEADLRLPAAIGRAWNEKHPGGDQDAVGGRVPIGRKRAVGVVAAGVAGVIAGRTEGFDVA